MSKKPSLAESLGKSRSVVQATVNNITADISLSKDNSEKQQIIYPSRMGKKPITGFWDPDVSRQLKLLAVNSDVTLQSLLTEAINDLFIKHGKSAIAK